MNFDDDDEYMGEMFMMDDDEDSPEFRNEIEDTPLKHRQALRRKEPIDDEDVL